MRTDLIEGDCRTVLGELAEASVDAIVTDPPYEFSFMGRAWDATGVAFDAGTWRAALRVAKPGAHLLAFGGTRTHHRLMCAIEDAGWEIRDCLMWVYGCLSEDTELLMDGQWVPYHKASAGNHALGYNVDTDTYEWMPIEEIYVYDYRDTAYRLHSDHTDQLVSRNHRCLIERGGNYVFQYAETLERQARVPILEDVPGLLAALPLPDQGASHPEQNLRPDVHGTRRQSRQSRDIPHALTGVSALRAGVSQCARRVYAHATVLFKRLLGCGAQCQPCLCSPHGQGGCLGQVRLDSGEPYTLPRKDVRGAQPRMEGRRHPLQDARQLCGRAVRALSHCLFADGAQGWLCDGAPAVCGASAWALPLAGRSGASQESPANRQPASEPAPVRQQPGPQAVRASRFTRADLVTVEPVAYTGKVWCIRVRSGAFVARRNGHVFVTGNSGFPKSHDVSKAIDKLAGAERPVVGAEKRSGSRPPAPDQSGGVAYRYGREVMLTAPAAEAARQWEGWGTALKPAYEPIVLGYRPLTVEQFVCMLTETIRSQLCQLSPVNDAARLLSGTRAKSSEVAHTVPEHARIYELANSGNVQFVASRFTSSRHASNAGMDGSAPSHARGNGSPSIASEATTLLGAVDDFLIRLADTSMSDATGGISESTVLSWNGISDALFPQVSTFTTAMGIRLTTALRTLSLFLSQSTSEDIGSSTPSIFPAYEPIILARKPFDSTVAGNVLAWGTGAINIGACRIGSRADTPQYRPASAGGIGNGKTCYGTRAGIDASYSEGRWPANLLLDEDAAVELDRQSGRRRGHASDYNWGTSGNDNPTHIVHNIKSGRHFGDSGGASRFFYVAKASTAERTLPDGTRNPHPTVKPVQLLSYLCRLITPEGGVVLDPFCGSGSTGVAALANGYAFIGIEQDTTYVALARQRLAALAASA